MILNLPRPLAVVAHDAGAANIILAWLAHEGLEGIRPAMAGPAAELWRHRFGSTPFRTDPEWVLEGAAALLSGTGWASDFEHRARVAAARLRLRSVALLDHWVNYDSRFERSERQLPSQIWVTDDHARALAEEQFPGLRIECRPNLYLTEQVREAGPMPPDGDVLFVAEPARSNWGAAKAGEFQALDHFLARRRGVGIPSQVAMRLRPHPSDPPNKFADWLAEHENVHLDTSPDLATALAGARWVVGLNSMALVVALEAGRIAISALPPGAPACALPHDGLIRL